LQTFGEDFIARITPTDEQQDLIEVKTRPQSHCIRWHEERFCRLTASNFGCVLQRKSQFHSLALELLQPKCLQNVPAIQWGVKHEAIAFECYENNLATRHHDLTLRKSGIVIGNPPYLAASPDGVLVDRCGRLSALILLQNSLYMKHVNSYQTFIVIKWMPFFVQALIIFAGVVCRIVLGARLFFLFAWVV